MPPKAKYTREEIIETAFQMTRENGIESVVARELGKRLGTSSSPIFTAFKNMEELQTEVSRMAMREFESYVSDALNYTPAFKFVGMKMIEFAKKEPNLFKLVYMMEHEEERSYSQVIAELGNTVEVCIEVIKRDYDLSKEEAEIVFRQVWLHTFGICVLVAGRICRLTDEEISEMLSLEFGGILMQVKSGKFKTQPVLRIDETNA